MANHQVLQHITQSAIESKKKDIWAQYVSSLVKAEKAKHNVTYPQLAELLKIHCDVDTKPEILATKVNRGTFSATLLVQIFIALGCTNIRLD